MVKAKAKNLNSVGRRKRSVARVFLTPSGKGIIKINDRAVDEYFENDVHRNLVVSPLKLVKQEKKVDLKITVKGGGKSGQADAIKLGVARALLELDPTFRKDLKAEGMISVDSRKKERKKYGRKKARKSPQFSKR